jgi:hypothetical protein
MDQSLIALFDEVLSQVQTGLPKKVLFRGEGTGGIASYVAGWMAGQGMDVIVLDGANRFNPYIASSFARKALIPPEEILKRIWIARAFTCYQMATLMGEKLVSFLRAIRACTPECGLRSPRRLPSARLLEVGFAQASVSARRRESPLPKTRVILLGPITTFLDEDVPEREVRPLFERALKKVENMVVEGVSFFLFQSSASPSSKRAFLMKRLSDFSDLVWRISLEDEGPKMILEKRWEKHQIPCLPDPVPTEGGVGRQAPAFAEAASHRQANIQ